MENSRWIKIEKDCVMPEEEIGVMIHLLDKNGHKIFAMAHHIQRVWFVFDLNDRKFQIYNRQQFVTHWKYLHKNDFPS